LYKDAHVSKPIHRNVVVKYYIWEEEVTERGIKFRLSISVLFEFL
jgi:hypothetical protein